MMNPADQQQFNQAVSLYQTGRRAEAGQIFNRLHLNYPNDVNVLLWQVYTANNPYDARNAYATAARLDPNHPGLAQAQAWLQQNQPQPQVTVTSSSSYSVKTSSKPKRSGRFWLIFILLSLLVIGLIIAYAFLWTPVVERPAAEKVLNDFMRTAATGNLDSTYTFVSPSVSKNDVKTKFLDTSAAYLAKYDHLQVLTFDERNNDEDDDAFHYLVFSGVAYYKDLGSGSFNAELENVNGNWRVVTIDLGTPTK